MSLLCKLFGHKVYDYHKVGKCFHCSRCGEDTHTWVKEDRIFYHNASLQSFSNIKCTKCNEREWICWIEKFSDIPKTNKEIFG